MKQLTRITTHPEMMGGKPCIRGIRVTVSMILGLMASGYFHDEILRSIPDLRPEDLTESLAYATWRVKAVEIPVNVL